MTVLLRDATRTAASGDFTSGSGGFRGRWLSAAAACIVGASVRGHVRGRCEVRVGQIVFF